MLVGIRSSASIGDRSALRARVPRRGTWTAERHELEPANLHTVGESVGLIPPTLRVHDLRHTAASLMIASGAGVKIVQQQLGHASATLILDRYAHLFPDELDALSNALDGLKARTPADSSRTIAGSTAVADITT